MPKIKAAVACVNPETVERVYSDRLKVIAAITDLNPERMTAENAASGLFADTEVLFSTWGMPLLTEKELDALPKLKAVFYAAGDTRAFHGPLLKRGILVSSAWKSNAVPVAEFAFAQIVLGLKNYFAVSAAVHAEKRFWDHPVGPGAYGTTVALIGAGAISQRIQDMLKNMDVNTIVVPSREEHRTVSLEEAFRTAQVVSNHLPDMGEKNAKVLTGAMFESMLPNAVFINTGRGRQVDEAGLIAALKKRPDITALLDVTYPEPPPPDSELYTLPNVRLSPHMAGSMNGEVLRMADAEIEEFKRYRDGEPLENLIQA